MKETCSTESTSALDPVVLCLCGCGQGLAHRYRPGHDARHASALLREWRAASAVERVVVAERAARVLSPALMAKFRAGASLPGARRSFHKVIHRTCGLPVNQIA